MGWVSGSGWRIDWSLSWFQFHLFGRDRLLVHHQVLQIVQAGEEDGRVGEETVSDEQWN